MKAFREAFGNRGSKIPSEELAYRVPVKSPRNIQPREKAPPDRSSDPTQPPAPPPESRPGREMRPQRDPDYSQSLLGIGKNAIRRASTDKAQNTQSTQASPDQDKPAE